MKRLAAEDFDEQWDPFHTCVGHNPEDLQPFHNLFPSWDAFNSTLSDAESPAEGAATGRKPAGLKQYYKNKELYDLLRPDTEHLPYLYDNFQWPHCSVSQSVERALGVVLLGFGFCSLFFLFFFLTFGVFPICFGWLVQLADFFACTRCFLASLSPFACPVCCNFFLSHFPPVSLARSLLLAHLLACFSCK